MGAGGRYSVNRQPGNSQQSPNHGGEHTGCGKYRNGGIYSQGVRFKNHSHREYTPGSSVKYIGSHRDFNGGCWVVLEKQGNVNCPRSTIRIKMNNTNKVVYINKRNLRFM
jgi:hypothetical protein